MILGYWVTPQYPNIINIPISPQYPNIQRNFPFTFGNYKYIPHFWRETMIRFSFPFF
jgi:hypothetical protein